ncbi:hypothetical protein GALMADRAFT_43078, partial [Galerina marginata CBS 339.88]
MSLTTCGRRQMPFLQCLCRHYSSGHGEQKPVTAFPHAPPQSHTTLPPAKVRALIALYHQADSWITEKDLLDRIDNAFVPELPTSKSPADHDYLHGRTISWTRMEDLEKVRKEMKIAPKMAQWDRSLSGNLGIGADWSGKASKRELKVIAALYGVESPADERLLPGLEVLREVPDYLDREIMKVGPDEEDELD